MNLFPAIDLKDGRCVRLVEGRFDSVHQVAEDAVSTIQTFASVGARFAHMVDLDGAKDGVRLNRRLILSAAAAFDGFLQVGGGIRTLQDVEDYLQNGVARVILGSAAVQDPDFLQEAVRQFGDRIAVGIDARNGMVCIAGWCDTADVNYLEFAKKCEQVGVKTLIFTDISKDGRLAGPNYEQLGALSTAVGCDIVASGGVTCIEDVEKLRDMGLYGAIVGKAIYAGTIDLSAAVLAAGQKN